MSNKKEITFHLNHYLVDENIYLPIIDKLVSDGWEIDRERTNTEIIGTSTFNNVWLKRVFTDEKKDDVFYKTVTDKKDPAKYYEIEKPMCEAMKKDSVAWFKEAEIVFDGRIPSGTQIARESGFRAGWRANDKVMSKALEEKEINCRRMFELWQRSETKADRHITHGMEQSLKVSKVVNALPSTFYSDLPLDERVKMLSEQWNRAIVSNQELSDSNEKLKSLVEHEMEQKNEIIESIILTEDLEVGKKTIIEEGRGTYTTHDFFAKKGTTIRKHESGLVEVFYYNEKSEAVMTIPIGQYIPTINNWTEQVGVNFDNSIGEKVWKKALEQKQNK